MVELAPSGDGQFVMGYAGDTFNTAWYLRQLLPSATVDYVSAVGGDSLSDDMLRFMADEGIGTAHIQRVPGRSVGLYMIRLVAGERSFAYWRSTSAARLLAKDAGALATALAGARLAYLSGITLAILDDAGRGRLLSALRAARAAGVQVAFDPNIRPALWPDAGVMRSVLTQAAGGADIVLPSFDDEARVFGDANPLATARRYSAAGAGLVVVKDGPGDVVTLQGGAVLRHALPAVLTEVVDTTAAGDSFNAGLLAGLVQGAGLEVAVLDGAALASRVIAAPGALVRQAVV